MRASLLWALALSACSGSPTSAPAPTPRVGPSVLIITLDTTRADRLGPYGYDLAETPAYDRFAEQGALWTRAYSTCPLTIPSHSTIFTGRVPPSHGVRDNGDFILSDDAITLAERFHDAGYQTAAFTSAFPTQKRWGFGQGFDIYHDPLERPPTQLDWRDERSADQVVDDAIATLATLDGSVFSWVHLFDAHWPYAPPEPFLSRHEGRPYDGEIAFAADQVGRLLAAWEAQHPDSVVLITSDHGEGLGDGGEKTHGFLLHDGTIRVPMMLKGPGVKAGARYDDPVSHIDIAPTLLALAGLPVHDAVQGKDLRQGGSERPYSEALTGQFNLGLAPLFAYSDGGGRYTEGSWGGWYPASNDRVAVNEAHRETPTEADTLGVMRARFDEVVGESVALDSTAMEQLMALGYVGGDPTAEAGEIDPRDVIDLIPLTWQARQAIGAGRFPVAEKLIARLEQAMPQTYGVDTLRAQLLRRQGRVDEATARYTDLFLRSPSSKVALQLASLATTRGDWRDAQGWFLEALEMQPASPEAMSGLVRCAMQLGEVDRADALASDYLLIYPDHVELVLIRAELALLDERPDDALRDAKLAVADLPLSPWAITVEAQALWAMGEADRSIERLQDALVLNPFNAPIRRELVGCLLEVRRNAEAVRVIAPLARLWPDHEEVQATLLRAKAALEIELGEQ